MIFSLFHIHIIFVMQEEAHVLHLSGKAESHMWFIEGGDQLDVDVEFLEADKKPQNEEAGKKKNVKKTAIKCSFLSHLFRARPFSKRGIAVVRSNIFYVHYMFPDIFSIFLHLCRLISFLHL